MPKTVPAPENFSDEESIAGVLRSAFGNKAEVEVSKNRVKVDLRTGDPKGKVMINFRHSRTGGKDSTSLVIGPVPPTAPIALVSIVKMGIFGLILLSAGILPAIIFLVIAVTIVGLIARSYWNNSAEVVKTTLENAFASGDNNSEKNE